MNTSVLMGTDKMILRCAYHKPFKVQLSNKHEWQNGFNLENNLGPGLVYGWVKNQ